MSVNYREGQLVRKGDVLVEIDPRPFQALLTQVEGQYARDKALLENAYIDLSRYQTAYSKNAIPKQQLDTQVATVHQLEGTVQNDQSTQDLRVGGRSGNAQYQYTIQSDNLEDLNKWGPVLLEQMKKEPMLADVNSDQQNSGLQASLVYDRATASRVGITPQMVDDTLYDAFGQRQVSTMFTALNQYHIVMEVEPRFWQSPEGLKNIYLHPATGGNISTTSGTASSTSGTSSTTVATRCGCALERHRAYEPSTAPLAVNHQGQFPSVTLSFNLKPGVALSDAVQAINRTEQSIGMPATIHGSFSGTAQGVSIIAGERASSHSCSAAGGLHRVGNSL